MKDYYEILGLEEDASQEEIRERWLELTKIYHPDVLKSPDADERIKEINEAYQVLKDYSSRLEYDLQRALQKSVLKKIVEKEEKKSPWPKIILPTGVLIALALMIFYLFFKVPPQHEQVVKIPVPEEAKIEKSIPPPAQAPLHLAELEKGKLQEKPIAPLPPQEEVKPLSPEKKFIPSKIEPAKPGEKKPTLAKVVIKETKKEPEKVKIITPPKSPEPAKIIPSEKPSVQPPKLGPPVKPLEVEKPEEITRPIPSAVAKVESSLRPLASEQKKLEVPEKLEKPPIPPQKLEPPIKPGELEKPPLPPLEPKKLEAPKEMAKAPVSAAVKAPIPMSPELKEEKPEKVDKGKEITKPAEIEKDLKPEPAKVIQPERPQMIEAKKPEKVAIPEKPITSKEEEVNKFLAGYVSKYKQKDVDGFLSYFSSRAIQNQKYNLGEIKKIYTSFFDRSQELNYSLQEVQTTDHPQGLEVRAKYELHQVTKKDGEKKSWKGQIRWILVRENGQLKIISLDYQHQK
ncbi:MAG: DnaJ domain-containing protein [bacterium]